LDKVNYLFEFQYGISKFLIDPYHGPGQATGYCFSVPRGISVPSSLQNIYKELLNESKDSDYVNFTKPEHGDLTGWAQQGIFLLNTSLTVRRAKAASQSKFGWQTFTARILSHLSEKHEGIVFVLWGRHAQGCEKYIDGKKHLILKTSHPSGLSCHRGFLGSNHFIKINEYLMKQSKKPIDWGNL